MKAILDEFNSIENTTRKNNTSILGLIVVMVVMVITFGVVSYKLNIYYATHRLALESDGTVRKTVLISEREALTIEIKDFMSSFYGTFYSYNQYNIDSLLNLGLYKGDKSLLAVYEKYKNSGWYNTILQENVDQSSTINGYIIDVSTYPYKVSVTGIMILRQGDVVRRIALNGSCTLKNVDPNFPKNPHGFFIEEWKEERYEL